MSATTEGENPFVLRRQDEAVAVLTLNRGDRFNPLSSGMIAALEGEIERLAADPTTRVVVLAGAGKGYSAGHDLKEMRAHASDEAWQARLFADCGRMMMALTKMPQPVIARVHGIATAAGCQLVSMCDLAVAAETARFGLPGVNVGVFCTTPAVGVGRNVARKRVMEMLLTGDTIDAATALDWGLVNRVVPAADLDDEIRRLTSSIVGRSRDVVALGKKAFYDQIERNMAGAYAVAGSAMTRNMSLEDATIGMDTFLTKKGRP